MTSKIGVDSYLYPEKKGARVEVNISLAFLHWVAIALNPWFFVSDIAVFVQKRGVKLQLTYSHFFPYHENCIYILLLRLNYEC